MNLRNLSFFSSANDQYVSMPAKSLSEYLFDTFNWCYEHSPINFSSLTGIYHPSIARLSGNPIWGRAKEVTKDVAGLVSEVNNLAEVAKNDPKGRAYLSFAINPLLLVTRPEDIAQVLMQNSDNVDRGELISVFGKIFGESNLLSLPTNDEWHKKRVRLTQWIFQTDKLTDLVPSMQNIVDEFIKELQKEKNIQSMENFMIALTLDVFARTQFASDHLGENAEKLSNGFCRAMDIASNPTNTVLLKLDAVLKYFGGKTGVQLTNENKMLQKMLMDNFYIPNQDNLTTKNSLLREFFDNHPNDFESGCDEAIKEGSGLLLLAGHETTARLLHFSTILLSMYPQVVEKIKQEILANKPENDDWTYHDLKKLSYLGKVLKETLRLYPPFPIIPRMAAKSFVLADIPLCKTKEQYETAMANRDSTKDVIISEGAGVIVSPWVTHRLASLHKNPMEFNPDRFKSDSVDSNENYSWIPFGLGIRNCPGRRFAMAEVKIFLIRFLEKFDFKVTCETGGLLDILIQGTLKHKHEVQLQVESRNEMALKR